MAIRRPATWTSVAGGASADDDSSRRLIVSTGLFNPGKTTAITLLVGLSRPSSRSVIVLAQVFSRLDLLASSSDSKRVLAVLMYLGADGLPHGFGAHGSEHARKPPSQTPASRVVPLLDLRDDLRQ
jgi:hypothetical protein